MRIVTSTGTACNIQFQFADSSVIASHVWFARIVFVPLKKSDKSADQLEEMTRDSFKSLMEEVLGVNAGTLQDSDTRDTVEGWTSVADVQVLTAIATELGLEMDADLVQAESVGELLEALEEKGAFAG